VVAFFIFEELAAREQFFLGFFICFFARYFWAFPFGSGYSLQYQLALRDSVGIFAAIPNAITHSNLSKTYKFFSASAKETSPISKLNLRDWY
jgi:hypothetical protein